jgi:hypothetical protein
MKLSYNAIKGCQKLVIATVIVASALCAEAQSSGPAAKPPYAVSVFAAPPPGLSNPDSITTANGNIYIEYANATNPDGTGGFSTIVEYSATGKKVGTFQVTGKADGLKYNPFDHKIWALRNEDSNPALTLIDPETGVQTDYTYAQKPAHGGGYDDIVFTRGETFISASNPIVDAKGQNNFPSIVSPRFVGHQIFVTPVLEGIASLIDIATGQKVVALQSDPDSLKVDSAGDLVLDSQQDGDLIFINAPGSPNQAGLRLHLSNGKSSQITVDDTVFPTTPSGTIYVVDTSGNTVYAVKSDAFQPGGAYSASDSDGILGKVDLSTGLVSPIVTGMKSPHGALFVSALSEVSVSQSGGINLEGLNVDVAFTVERRGDLSKGIEVKYVVKDLASDKSDDSTSTGSVQIASGKSSAEFRVPITNFLEILEDGINQEATVILEAGVGYNVVDPATATFKLKLKDF